LHLLGLWFFPRVQNCDLGTSLESPETFQGTSRSNNFMTISDHGYSVFKRVNIWVGVEKQCYMLQLALWQPSRPCCHLHHYGHSVVRKSQIHLRMWWSSKKCCINFTKIGPWSIACF
jgi:hypothetical protein